MSRYYLHSVNLCKHTPVASILVLSSLTTYHLQYPLSLFSLQPTASLHLCDPALCVLTATAASMQQLLPDLVLQRPVAAVITILFGLFALSAVVSTIHQYSRLRHIKGPSGTGFTKYWLVKTVAGKTAYLDFWKVNQQYGKFHVVLPDICNLMAYSPNTAIAIFGRGVRSWPRIADS